MRRLMAVLAMFVLVVAGSVMLGAAEEEKTPRLSWRLRGWRTVKVKTLCETKSRHLRYFWLKYLEVHGTVKNDTERTITRGKLLVEVYKRRSFTLKGTPDKRMAWAFAEFGRVSSGSTVKWSCQMRIHVGKGSNGKLKAGEYIRISLWRSVDFEK